MESLSQVLTWLIFYTLSRKVTGISFHTLFRLVERFEAVEFIVYLTNDPNHLGDFMDKHPSIFGGSDYRLFQGNLGIDEGIRGVSRKK